MDFVKIIRRTVLVKEYLKEVFILFVNCKGKMNFYNGEIIIVKRLNLVLLTVEVA